MLAAAERDATALQRRVQLRVPALADRVVAAVVEELTVPDDKRQEGGSPQWAPGG